MCTCLVMQLERSIKREPIVVLDYSSMFLDGLDNEALTQAVLDNADDKMELGPNTTGVEDNKLPDTDLIKDFKAKLTDAVGRTINQRVELLEAWGHITPPNGSTNYHSHRMPFLAYSCVYYTKVPENAGDLIFLANACNIDFTRTEKAVVGKLVIFPCIIPHMTGKNMSGEDRVSISANFRVVTDE